MLTVRAVAHVQQDTEWASGPVRAPVPHSTAVARRDLKDVMQSAEKLRGLTSLMCITHVNSGMCYSRTNVYIYMCKALEHVLGSSSAARVQGSGRRPVLGVKEAPGRGRASRGPCDPVPDAEDGDDLALAAEIQQQRRVGERGRPRPSSSLRLLPCRGGRGGRGFLL